MKRGNYTVKDENLEKLVRYIERKTTELRKENLGNVIFKDDEFYTNYFPLLINKEQIPLKDPHYAKFIPGLNGSYIMCTGCKGIGKAVKYTKLSRFTIHDGCISFSVLSCSSCEAKKVNKSVKKRMSNDEDFSFLTKFRISHASRIKQLIKSKSNKKNFYSVIGCDSKTLINHISSQFVGDMNVSNYGLDGWTIDHLIPLSWARNREELFKLCHYTNLGPKWQADNISKGNKYGEAITQSGIVRITKEEYYKFGVLLTGPTP
jgi:hypothetical protein